MRVKLCAYDTGFGLMVSEYVGDEVHALTRIPGDKFKIIMPNPFNDVTWAQQKELVNEMVNAYNEKYGFTEKK